MSQFKESEKVRNVLGQLMGFHQTDFEVKEVSWAEWMMVREQALLSTKSPVDILIP